MHFDKMMKTFLKDFQVNSGSKVRLTQWDPDDTSLLREDKSAAQATLEKLRESLQKLQCLLYAEHKHKILIILQGMDTAGKDSTIRMVFEGMNPQGVRVESFKVPTGIESDHDYLWRIHQQTPAKGELVIFNRSHYEDVLVARVHDLVPQAVWEKRYHHISEFERLLSDEGTVILKFFLHISKDEQKKRLSERLDDSYKNWKFNEADLKERLLWAEYMTAYEEAIRRTSTPWAPWHIIPANHKWFRNLLVASIIAHRLESLKMHFPKAQFKAGSIPRID